MYIKRSLLKDFSPKLLAFSTGHHERQNLMDISGIVLVMDTKELAILLELLKDCKEFLVGDSSYQWVEFVEFVLGITTQESKICGQIRILSLFWDVFQDAIDDHQNDMDHF